MAILLFNRSLAFRFRDWLCDLEEEIVLFSQVDRPDAADYARVERIDSFDSDGRTDVRALEAARQTGVRTVFAHSEYDLIRAAKLRETLGLPGQSTESAFAYRDKVRMKQLAAKGGVAVPPYRRLCDPLDLHEFADQHGYPLVVKPCDGGGSRNTQVLRDREELQAWLVSGWTSGMMAEGYVEGDMYHVDGLVVGGEVVFASASRYVNGCLAFQDGVSLGSVLLDPESGMSDRMLAETRRVLDALPGAPVLAFHAEFFHTPDDRILLCEIASRTGGGPIVDTIREICGIQLNRAWVRLHCGLPEPLTDEREKGLLGGYLIVPSRPGTLLDIPESLPFDWVLRYTPSVHRGQVIGQAVSSVDSLATLIVKGSSEEIVTARLLEANEWLLSRLRWKEEEM